MFQPGSVIAGRYQVIRLVGQGGMSNLYLAYDRKYNNAQVVIKEMTASYSDPKEQKMAVDLFHREAKLLASLNHRHIPKVYDYFQFAGKYYLSMEFIDGGDLAERLEDSKGPLDERQVLEWGEQIATVLFYLHKHEPPIVFRDVKPSNIMICDQGIKLIDFGIARHFDQAKKGDTMRIGSPGYAPPEQYAAQTDPRSDIYALGVTLHHALTGRDPTATQTPFLVPPARNLNPNLSEATAAMLARATQLDPADRYQSVLEMKKDIKAILKRGKQSTRVVGAPPAPPVSATAGPGATTGGTSSQAPAATGQAAAQAASSSTTAQASPASTQPQGTIPNQSPGTGSGALTGAAANGSGSLGAQSQQATPQVPKKSKGGPLKALLLVACLCLVVAGVYQLSTAEQKESAMRWLRSGADSLLTGIGTESDPEYRLRKSLLAGDPAALLPLFDSEDLAGLSQEKQRLFRLNLLAAGASEGPFRVVHLLYPESSQKKDTERILWDGAAHAVASINGRGGLDKQLLVVLPQTYGEGRLQTVVDRLSQKEGSNIHSFLIVNPNGQETAQSEKPITMLGTADGVRSLDGTALQELFQDQLDSFESLLWAASETAPAGVAQKAPPPTSADELGQLLTRSEAENLTLALALPLPAERAASQGGASLLLLAPSLSQLPALPKDTTASAIVLSSAFNANPEPGALVLPPRDDLSVRAARVMDACVLAALPAEKALRGASLKRDRQGQVTYYEPKTYRWTENGWKPQQ